MRSGSSGRCGSGGSSGGRHTRLQRLGVFAGAARGVQLAEEQRRAREGGVGVGAGEGFVEELELEELDELEELEPDEPTAVVSSGVLPISVAVSPLPKPGSKVGTRPSSTSCS